MINRFDLHLVAGAAVAIVAAATWSQIFGTGAVWFGLGAAVLAGLLKEVYDLSTDGRFDPLDWLATAVGGLAVLLTGLS